MTLRRVVGPGLLTLALWSCGGGSTDPSVPASLLLTPKTVTIRSIGESVNLQAQAYNKRGKAISGGRVSWTSANPTIASVDQSGTVTGMKRGTTTIRALVNGVTGTASAVVAPEPAELAIQTGDGQVGLAGQTLPFKPSVQVRDRGGTPVEGATVAFLVTSGDGTVSTPSVITGPDGMASVFWTLGGCGGEADQKLRATSGGVSAEFEATLDPLFPTICLETLENGRATLPYSAVLQAAGGDPPTHVWSISGGSFPPGLDLSSAGAISGVPLYAGDYEFEIRVRNGAGNSDAREVEITVCDDPLDLEVGEFQVLSPPDEGGCGFFLPSGNTGDRYRAAAVFATTATDPGDVVEVAVSGRGFGTPEASAVSFLHGTRTGGGEQAALHEPDGSSPFLQLHLSREANQRHSRRIRGAERRLLSDPIAVKNRVSSARLAVPSGGAPAPGPARMLLRPNIGLGCPDPGGVPALKVAENDAVAVYQDSVQTLTDPVDPVHIQQVLGYALDYGQPVVESYFGGLPDVNGDGRVVLFVTPAAQTLPAWGWVWAGDLFSRSDCAASNQMEVVYLSTDVIRLLGDEFYEVFGVVTRQMKHISSIQHSLGRRSVWGQADPGYQPYWIEEGTARLAAETASRLAWADAGGPPVGSLVTRLHRRITAQSYEIMLRWYETIRYLGSQPNGVILTPAGAAAGHTMAGSGWHFHRWLGDGFGSAATPLADSTFFRAQNDSLTVSGIPGLEALTGRSWERLLEEYVVALMANGLLPPRPSGDFTSYDFPDVTRDHYVGQRDGFYPWPVNVPDRGFSAPFGTFEVTAPLGPTGIQVLDLTSSGEGDGVDVFVDLPRFEGRIVILRVH